MSFHLSIVTSVYNDLESLKDTFESLKHISHIKMVGL